MGKAVELRRKILRKGLYMAVGMKTAGRRYLRLMVTLAKVPGSS